MTEDPTSGYLYAVYQKNGFEDCSDRTYGPPHPNGEIWVSVSTDGGLNWSEGTDITNTHTPDCRPWDCACEMQPSINELVNDTLHIAYILDRDAAITDYGEMFITEAKVIYHKVAADLILPEPLIRQFSIYEGPERCRYLPGDLNDNGQSNGNDIVYAVNYLKGFGPPPTVDCDCEGITGPFYGAGDVNGNCAFNGVDVTFYVNYLKGLQQRILFCPGCPPDEARHAYEWPLRLEWGSVDSGERWGGEDEHCFQFKR